MATKKVNGAKASENRKSVEFVMDFLTKESEAMLVDFIGRRCGG